MGLEDLKDELHSPLLQRKLVDFDIATLKCKRKVLSIAIKQSTKRNKKGV